MKSKREKRSPFLSFQFSNTYVFNMKEQIQFVKNSRPPMEAVISNEFIKFVRNVLILFPCFTKWNDIYISKRLVNWKSEGQSIDKFLTKYQGMNRFSIDSKSVCRENGDIL